MKLFASCRGLALVAGILVTAAAVCPAAVVRGPYLQSGTSTGVVVRFRTGQAGFGRVCYGVDAGNLEFAASGVVSGTNHAVQLSGLAPDTFYFYGVGVTNLPLAGGTNYYFRTAPPIGARRPLRVWVLGDSGYTNQSAGPVRDAYFAFTTNHYTDAWLMLGDNAYHDRSDGVWQAAVFNTYSNLLRQTVVWSTIGNQETGNSATATPTTYLDNFTFPTGGEAGGVASGSEKYFSFDHGNVHFICLDSMSSDRTNGSPMLTWLAADLAANTSEWLIAFWHHPPYSKGSNDSDTRTEQVQMRTNAVRLLEEHGVDLVLAGHSHSYERSYLIAGHYGLSPTFSTNTMVRGGGDGRVGGAGAYRKATLGPGGNEGAVYLVAGSGASVGGGALNHPAMYRSMNRLGSLVLDIHANRLEGRFLRESGVIDDSFTIVKGAGSLILAAPVVTNNLVVVAWNSVADRTYRVEFAPALPATWWTDVSGGIKAGDVTTSWTGALGGGTGAGFYRVWSLDD